ncbi:MAG TPA: c-type cytochrome [Actinomycetota bacterium]
MGRRSRLVLAVAGLALAGVACTTSQPASPYRPPGVTPETVDEPTGAVLYQRDCAWCHGSAGDGTSFGPNLDGDLDGGAYTYFMLATGRMPLEDPNEEARRGEPRYDVAEVAAIVEHVETFGGTGPGVPAPEPGRGDLARGAELYLENCAACHSSTGVGGALTSGEVVPPLRHSSPVEVAAAMLVGPGCPNTSPTCGPGEGAMPRFEFDEEETNAIVRYVEYLRNPVEEGGAPIGFVGPVVEGAVALGVGLVALLIVIRWIGTRTERAKGREHG